MLYNKEPLVINTELAEIYGLNESIVIQQINYWTDFNKKTKKNFHDGYYWTYNTYEDWQKNFPFWSIRTIKRIILSLEKQGVIITSNYNKMKIDRTKWYRINVELVNSGRPSCQNGTVIVTEWHETSCQNDTTNNQRLPEINTETKNKNIDSTESETTRFKKLFESHYKELMNQNFVWIPSQASRYGKAIKGILSITTDLNLIERKIKAYKEICRDNPKYNTFDYINFEKKWNEIKLPKEPPKQQEYEITECPI